MESKELEDIQKKVDEVAQQFESATQHEGLGPAIFKEGVDYAFSCAKILADKDLQRENERLKECCEKIEAALKQFISYHETGLLPDIFTYKKGIEALKEGESNTPATGEGEKEADNG